MAFTLSLSLVVASDRVVGVAVDPCLTAVCVSHWRGAEMHMLKYMSGEGVSWRDRIMNEYIGQASGWRQTLATR